MFNGRRRLPIVSNIFHGRKWMYPTMMNIYHKKDGAYCKKLLPRKEEDALK
jgi:hypothetical protein